MSRSFKKYPLYKSSFGRKDEKRIMNKKLRYAKEVKNNGHYKKFYNSFNNYRGPRYTKEDYIKMYGDVMLLDELYKDWIVHYYCK